MQKAPDLQHLKQPFSFVFTDFLASFPLFLYLAHAFPVFARRLNLETCRFAPAMTCTRTQGPVFEPKAPAWSS
jgi:hypothetical protein